MSQTDADVPQESADDNESANESDDESATTTEASSTHEDFLHKNTKSFRCLTQVEISRSSLLLDPFYWFPELVDPKLNEALWNDEAAVVYDDVGREKYIDLCKEECLRPYRRVLNSLEGYFLDLRFYGLGEKEMKTICETLAINSHVKSITLQENFLSPAAFKYVDDMLQKNNTITNMDLKDCRIGPIGAHAFREGFAFTKTLQELDLSGNNLGDDGVIMLANVLQHNQSIRRLNLSHNSLNDGALIAMADVLEDNYMITDLDLSWNYLYNADGMTAFMDSLQENMSIKNLNLSWCGIGDRENMRPIFNYLKSETAKLEHLNLSNNRINGVAVKMLKTGLKYNEYLITLNLSSNPMEASEVEFLTGTFLEPRDTPMALTTIDFSNITVNKSFIRLRNQCRRKGFTVKVGEVVGNYRIKGPSLKHILMERAKFVAMTQKKKKWRQDFGIFLICLSDDPITRTDFTDLMKKKKSEIRQRFVGAHIKNIHQ